MARASVRIELLDEEPTAGLENNYPVEDLIAKFNDLHREGLDLDNDRFEELRNIGRMLGMRMGM